jgi:hypothetical protein
VNAGYCDWHFLNCVCSGRLVVAKDKDEKHMKMKEYIYCPWSINNKHKSLDLCAIALGLYIKLKRTHGEI